MAIHRAPSGHRCGESHYRARLTDAQVREIRLLSSRHGYGYRVLSQMYRCGQSTIRDIVTYRTRINA